MSGANSLAPAATDLVTNQETVPRSLVTASVTLTDSLLVLSGFTARKSETVTSLRVITTGTAAAATPTLIRLGLYTITAADAGALVASTTTDLTLFAAANTAYTKALTTPYAVTAGVRYAIGLLVVTAGAAPTVAGATAASFALLNAEQPRLSATFAAQSNLPATFVAGDLANTVGRPWVVLVP